MSELPPRGRLPQPAELGSAPEKPSSPLQRVEEWPEVEGHLRCMLPKRSSLREDEALQVIKLINDFSDIFVGPEGQLGWTDKTEHRIHLEPGAVPYKGRPRAKSFHDKKFIEEEVARLLKAGKIRPSKSPWGAPVVLVRKKDGTLRFCIDFRELNDKTRKDAYPVPRIDELLDSLNGSKYFCTLDLASGYWQIAMHTDDVDKTAFTTHSGLFEWIVMPFGLCNAPATFCRLMETVLSDIMWSKCLVYLDDIIAFGKSFSQTLCSLKAVFVRLRENRLKLKAKKCELFKNKVDYLGHEVSDKGVRPSPSKVNSLHNIALPATVTEVKSFLGVCSYYRRFIPKFSEIAVPLNDLTKKGAKVDTTTPACVEAFETLKRMLIQAPNLHFIDPDLPFILDTDASDNAIGACLAQLGVDEDGIEFEKPIAFASKTLTEGRRRYCTTKKELYAVVYYMNYWANLFSGGDLTVRTDHASLLWLIKFGKSTGNTPGMYFRWAAQVTTHSMVRSLRIIHRPGKEHLNADGMSRMVKSTHSRLKVPPGTKVKDCKYPDCVDCSVERALNVKARGSDSEDSDPESEGDHDFDIPVGYEVDEVNDLPIHCILYLRLVVQLQLPLPNSYLDEPFVLQIETVEEDISGETLLILNAQIPERRSERIAEKQLRKKEKDNVKSVEKAEPERRSTRLAEKQERLAETEKITTSGLIPETVVEIKMPQSTTEKNVRVRRNPRSVPELIPTSVKDQTIQVDPLTMKESDIERLTNQLASAREALNGKFPHVDLYHALEVVDMGVQVNAYDLNITEYDAEGVQLLDERMLSDEMVDSELMDEMIERVPEVCPPYTDKEWVDEQYKDSALKRVRQIVNDCYWAGVKLHPDIQKEAVPVKPYLRLMPELVVAANGILCWKESVSLVESKTGFCDRRLVPSKIRIAIFHRVHRRELIHVGYEKIYYALRKRYWWPNMASDILEWCRACESCQNSKPGPGGSRNPLLQRDITFEPMDRLGIDLVIFTTPTERGNSVLLVVQDYASKYVELFGLPDKKARTVERVITDEVLLRYGACLRIHSDQGREFDNDLFNLQCARWKIDKTRTSGYAPWSNGQVERSNRTLKGMLRQIGNVHSRDWDEHLPKTRAAINNSITTNGSTPFKVMMTRGTDAKMPIDLFACEQSMVDDRFNCHSGYLVYQEQVMVEILVMVRESLNTNLRLQADAVLQNTLRIRHYELGSWVLRKVSPAERDTFQRYRWRGPCRVLGVNPSGHLVKILVPGVGRPYLNGKPNVIAKWINTSNVKPCRLDKHGRLLYVQEYCICPHTKEVQAELVPVCWQCEDKLHQTALNLKPFEDQKWLAPLLPSELDKVPQHAYVCTKYPNLERNPEVIEEIKGEITMPKVLYGGNDGITSINYFCEIQDVECLKDNGLFNYEARYCCEPFWNTLITPGWEGPKLPEEVNSLYMDDGSDFMTDWSIKGIEATDTASVTS